MSDSKQQKYLLRQKVRGLRNQISSQQALLASQPIVAQLKGLDCYQKAKRVACYISFDGEINTHGIIEQIWQDNKACFLPKIRPHKPNRLWFMPFTNTSQLMPNRFGIPEVELAVDHSIAVSKLDIILMPLVAFDLYGNRLGMGGGYYDATLAHLISQNYPKKPQCIGLAYQQQCIESLPTQVWDHTLNGVITPEKYYNFNG